MVSVQTHKLLKDVRHLSPTENKDGGACRPLRPIDPTHGEKVPSSFSMPCSAALRQRRSVEFLLEPVGEVQLGQLAVVVVNALVSASS